MAIPDNCVKIDQAYIDSDTALETGTYLVSGSVTTDARIEISGSVTLILENGCHLTAKKGIHVGKENALTITAQSDDENTMGKLTATGVEQGHMNSDYNAVIGGNGSASSGENGGSITINGGKITATTPYFGSGAAIGGGNRGNGGVISITGGIVTATSYTYGAGIGGGVGGNGGIITISGGTVTATGIDGAGIGGGVSGNGGQITITGGDVTTYTQTQGAGIGGGTRSGIDGQGDGGTIVISGGVVRAYGANGAAGIGNGYDADDTPGTFFTQLLGQPAGNAVVYTNSVADMNDTSDWNGIFFIGSDTVGKVYGHVILPGDYTVAAKETVTIPADAVLTVPAGVTLTVEGEIVNDGTIICDGTIIGAEKITGTGTIEYPEPEPEPEPEEEPVYIPSEPISDGVHEYSMGKMLYIDGKRVKGLYEYEGATYFFNEQGFMQTGWVEFDEGWRYFAEDGKMVTGWLQLGNVWYYLDPETGIMFNDGLATIGKSTYYFHDWGGMASDWWYEDENGDWYFFGGSGAMKAASWVEWKGEWYYLTETGKMAADTYVGDYHVNASGVWDNG